MKSFTGSNQARNNSDRGNGPACLPLRTPFVLELGAEQKKSVHVTHFVFRQSVGMEIAHDWHFYCDVKRIFGLNSYFSNVRLRNENLVRRPYSSRNGLGNGSIRFEKKIINKIKSIEFTKSDEMWFWFEIQFWKPCLFEFKNEELEVFIINFEDMLRMSSKRTLNLKSSKQFWPKFMSNLKN